MNKKDSPYTAAITGGGFLFEETNILLPLLRATNSEELLHDEKVNNRLLHINAESSRKKAILEIKRRYESMPSSFWDDFLGMNDTDKIVAIFYVILRTYKICFDFHVNVAIKKWNSISKSIDKNDIMILTGYSETQSKLLIRQAKLLLVEKGFNWYKNKRVGRVPVQIIENILGFQIISKNGIIENVHDDTAIEEDIRDGSH